jgi:putative endonuclease
MFPSIIEISCPTYNGRNYYMYLLTCSDSSFYCGSTNNLQKRLKEHNAGEAAEWTKKRRPVKLVYFEIHPTLITARQREKQVKGWTRKKKIQLINGTLGAKSQI